MNNGFVEDITVVLLRCGISGSFKFSNFQPMQHVIFVFFVLPWFRWGEFRPYIFLFFEEITAKHLC